MTRDQTDDRLKLLAAQMFGAVLTHAMDAADLTPPLLAKIASVERSGVYRILRGHSLPKPSTTERLDKAVRAQGLLVTIRSVYDQVSDRQSAATSGAPLIVGPWRLDVDEKGRLVAVNEDGTSTVLAGDPP